MNRRVIPRLTGGIAGGRLAADGGVIPAGGGMALVAWFCGRPRGLPAPCRSGAARVLAACAALLVLGGCPETTPDKGQFAAADGAAADLGGPGGDATGSDVAGSDAAGSDAAASDTPGSDAAPLDSDSTAADSASDTGADASQDGDATATCGCSSAADCAGVVAGICQVVVCASCTCLVEFAADGSPCAGGACQKGQCLPKGSAGPWATAVAAGGHHSCARHPDGSASCWGAGSAGQLGNGGTASAVKQPKLVAGLLVIDQLSAGNAHTCARHSGGKVSCWGDNFNQQIGAPDTTAAVVPTQAGTLADATGLATGTYGSFAIRKGATLWGWGKNNDGQLLLGNLLAQQAPVQIAPILGASKVCAGENFVCAVLGDGKVWCWGRNSDGQLGHGTASYDSPPQPAGVVNGLPLVQDIACGHQHACAWDAAGKAWCWGKNLSGQIGTGSYSASPVNAAVQLEVSGVVGMACGQGHTCALRGSGEVLCWGDNDEGQSGADKPGDVYQPLAIALGGKASAVAAGISHSCALRQDGAVLCWGKGSSGQLGDGLATSSAKAVVVAGSGKP